MRYITQLRSNMICSIRHKGLKRLHESDNSRGVIAEHAQKLRDILARLDAASGIADMDMPGFKLHPLKGERKVSGRLPFAPTGG
jgi:proteic killer suppression protein